MAVEHGVFILLINLERRPCKVLRGMFSLLVWKSATNYIVLNGPCRLFHNPRVFACVSLNSNSFSWISQWNWSQSQGLRHWTWYDLCTFSVSVHHHLIIPLYVLLTFNTSTILPSFLRIATFAQRVAVCSCHIRRKTVMYTNWLIASFVIRWTWVVSPIIERTEVRCDLWHFRCLHWEITPNIIESCFVVVQIPCDLLSV